MTAFNSDDVRRWYAEELRVTAPIRRNEAVVEAFAAVPRENFLGPGPWRVLPPNCLDAAYVTPDADPHWLYHDVLVSIDQQRDLNNGQPSLWGRLFDNLNLKHGQRVMQIGAGTGYYSAVLAEIAGTTGRIIAIEYDGELATRAKSNLALWQQVETIHADGTTYDPGEIDVVIAFAGATHPASIWLDRLADGGQLLMPLTGGDRWGFFLQVTRRGTTFEARSLGRCGFIHCVGGRDEVAAVRLQRALRRLRGRSVPVQSLHRGEPPKIARPVWYSGPGFWLSRRPPPATSY